MLITINNKRLEARTRLLPFVLTSQLSLSYPHLFMVNPTMSQVAEVSLLYAIHLCYELIRRNTKGSYYLS